MRVFVCLLSALALCQGNHIPTTLRLQFAMPTGHYCWQVHTSTAAYDYKAVLRNSLLFYEAQRSGKLPPDQKVTWRKDSALNDKGENGEDLTGGYYDAGDYVKFGFPMAYTTTVLAWGAVDYEAGYTAAGALDDVLKAIKWATDYFFKAHVAPTVFYGQVGQGDVDHAFWGRPEDMRMPRPAFKIDTSRPGSDLAAETAAALAAASIVFKNVDPSYSNNLLTHAKQLFDFAKNYRGKYSDSITDAKKFYASSNYKDELVWGAAWLYRATNDTDYLNTAESLYNEFGFQNWNGAFNWDNKISGTEVLLAKLTKKQQYMDKIKGYVDYLINNQKKTPKGLLYMDMWGPIRHAANAALIMLEAADLGLSAASYRQFAKTQIDYALGDGGRSFVCGFGNNPPTHPHHRSSSCPPAPAACEINMPGPNYHVLTGALVGGPDEKDYYVDDRGDYVHNEVAIDYNAGFQSAIVALVFLGY